MRGRARRGRAAGSCRREARSGRGASLPRPSSHNFAAREGAGSGPREARAGEGAGTGASPEPAGLAPEPPARTGQGEARGADVSTARVVRGGRALESVYSSPPGAAPAYLRGSPPLLPGTNTAAAVRGRAPLGSQPGDGDSGKATVAEAVPRARARDPYLKPRAASASPLPCPRSRPPGRPPPLWAAAGRQQPGHPRRRGGASGRTASAGGSGSARSARLELAGSLLPTRRPRLPRFLLPRALSGLLGLAFCPIHKRSPLGRA